MADEADIANDLMANEVSRALNEMRHKNNSRGKGVVKYCIECGDDIPKGRQKLGFVRCVSCAEEAERKESLFTG